MFVIFRLQMSLLLVMVSVDPGLHSELFWRQWETSLVLRWGCWNRLVSIASSSGAVSLRSASVLAVTLLFSPLRLCQFWHETSKLVFTHCRLSRLTLGVPAAEHGFQGQMGSQAPSKGLCLLKIRTQNRMSLSRPFCRHLWSTAVTEHRARHWGPPGDGDREPSLEGNHGQGEELDK